MQTHVRTYIHTYMCAYVSVYVCTYVHWIELDFSLSFMRSFSPHDTPPQNKWKGAYVIMTHILCIYCYFAPPKDV